MTERPTTSLAEGAAASWAGRLKAAFARCSSATWIAPKWRSLVPWLLAILPALLVAPEIISKIPMSRDHATHLFKVWHFWTELVPSGRLRGWSPYWVFGFPSDELVPCGGELWVGLFRGLTVGLLPWDRTYAVAFAALMVLECASTFALTRRFFGPTAAVLAAWITFYDNGEMLEGGWTWHTYWGVWPVTLAASLAQLCILKLDEVLVSGRSRDVLGAALLFAGALLTHQLTLVLFAMVTPLLMVDHALRKDRPTALGYAKVVSAVVFGTSLCGFYLIPFLARTDQTMDLGWLHEPLAEVSKRFVEFRTFQKSWAPLQLLGIIGGVWALTRRKPGGVLFAATCAACVFFASDVLVRSLHLERAWPTLVKVEVNRLLLVAKLFWWPLAGFALERLWHAGLRRTRMTSDAGRSTAFGIQLRQLGTRHAGIAAVGLGLGALMVVPGWKHLYDTQLQKAVSGQTDQKYWADYQGVLEWSKRLRDSSTEPYRIAYDTWRGDHLSTAWPVYNGTVMYKFGYTPTQIYNKLPMIATPALLEASSVKYVVSANDLKWPSLEFERKFGSLSVYEFTRYSPNPFRLTGPGQAELLESDAEHLRLRLSGTGNGSRLRLHVGAYPRWEARIDGQPVPTSTVTVDGIEDPFLMEVAAHDGELTLDYVYRAADWIGLFVTWLSIPVFGFVWWLGGRVDWFHEGSAWVQRRAGRLALLSTAVPLAGAIWVASRTEDRRHLLPPDSIFHEDGLHMNLAGVDCKRLAPLDFECGPHRVTAEAVADAVWGVHLCMQAPGAGPLRLSVPVGDAQFIWGAYAVPKKAKGTLGATLAGKSLGHINTRPHVFRRQFVQFDVRDHVDPNAPLLISMGGAPLNCFDFRRVR